MLPPEDVKMLEQIAKEAKEYPGFNDHLLFDLFFGGQDHILMDICQGDDGKIDPNEGYLLDWYFYHFKHLVRTDYNYADIALSVVFDKLDS